ncbi:MAG: GNAT family N-acetyltransferase [Burkholderiales bacterium]|nr:GNAT family N-acetyltransferase [Burkholderiales bacterium]
MRRAQRTDLARVNAIDAAVTRLPKPDYWRSVFRRYGARADGARQFLVATVDRQVVGFVIGEIRDWEFGSPPCGWVFAISVDPAARQAGVGSLLLDAISEGFRRKGVTKLRTMLSRDNTLILSFFRSRGMTAGSLLPLEMELE